MPGSDRGVPAAVAALGRGRGEEPAFLEPHHLAAAERVQRLFERAHLRPRTTMHYGPRVGAGRRPPSSDDIADMAADARRKLAGIYGLLPAECAGVVIDVCGFEKGLQDIEAERCWPRRSAKLVLRIGLEALARHYGFGETAAGPETGRSRSWVGEGARPTEVG